MENFILHAKQCVQSNKHLGADLFENLYFFSRINCNRVQLWWTYDQQSGTLFKNISVTVLSREFKKKIFWVAILALLQMNFLNTFW